MYTARTSLYRVVCATGGANTFSSITGSMAATTTIAAAAHGGFS